ncbi:hypothetical protein H9P43_005739 [Blastocladiella emersonii ATCC 22665]|nr:hypothetical protein H9P43_005739 [Blastocladiella emersonii ATCC 22665]
MVLRRSTPRDVLAVSRLSRKFKEALSSTDEALWHALLRAQSPHLASAAISCTRQLAMSPRDLYFAVTCRAEIYAWGDVAAELNEDRDEPRHVPIFLELPSAAKDLPINQVVLGGRALYVTFAGGMLAVLGTVVADEPTWRHNLMGARRDLFRVIPAHYGAALLTAKGKWVRSEVTTDIEDDGQAPVDDSDVELGPSSLIVGSGSHWLITFDPSTFKLRAYQGNKEHDAVFPFPGVKFVGNSEDDYVVATTTTVHRCPITRAVNDSLDSDWTILHTCEPGESILQLSCSYMAIGIRTTHAAMLFTLDRLDGPVLHKLPSTVSSLATGIGHHGYLDTAGDVYTRGYGACSDGVSGHDDSERAPTLLKVVKNQSKVVIDLVMGGDSSAAVVIPVPFNGIVQ